MIAYLSIGVLCILKDRQDLSIIKHLFIIQTNSVKKEELQFEEEGENIDDNILKPRKASSATRFVGNPNLIKARHGKIPEREKSPNKILYEMQKLNHPTRNEQNLKIFPISTARTEKPEEGTDAGLRLTIPSLFESGLNPKCKNPPKPHKTP